MRDYFGDDDGKEEEVFEPCQLTVQEMIGKKFGEWLVVGTSKNLTYCKVVCSCGEQAERQKMALLRSISQRCIRCNKKRINAFKASNDYWYLIKKKK